MEETKVQGTERYKVLEKKFCNHKRIGVYETLPLRIKNTIAKITFQQSSWEIKLSESRQ